MCLVSVLVICADASAFADWLSIRICVGFCGNPSSSVMRRIQTVSLAASFDAMYSASVDEAAMIDCILERHEIRHQQKSTRKPALDLELSGQFW